MEKDEEEEAIVPLLPKDNKPAPMCAKTFWWMQKQTQQ